MKWTSKNTKELVDEKTTSFTIPEKFTSIDVAAFNNCQILRLITIPKEVTFIGEGAFDNCPNLISLSV